MPYRGMLTVKGRRRSETSMKVRGGGGGGAGGGPEDIPGKIRHAYGALLPEQQLFVQVLYIFLVVSVMLNVSANTLRLLKHLQLYPFW